MRATDPTVPSRRSRLWPSPRNHLHRIICLVLLLVMIATVLPVDQRIHARANEPEAVPATVEAGADTGPSRTGPDTEPEPQSAGVSHSSSTEETTGVRPPRMADPSTRPETPVRTSTQDPPPAQHRSGSVPESTDPVPPLTHSIVSDPTAVTEPVMAAADTSRPAVCQLVLAVTAIAPPSGAPIGVRLPDPVGGAAFSASVGDRGGFVLLTDANGALNVVTQTFASNGIPVTDGDVVTVSQISTRTGLTLGNPAFTATFAWRSAYAASCRVETFVINPVLADVTPPPSVVASGDASPSPSGSTTMSPAPSTETTATVIPVSLSPDTSSSPAPSAIPSPSDSPPSPSPTPSRIVTATTVPTATTAPAIPAGFGQIEVWAVASRAPEVPTGQAASRLPGARFIVVERQTRTLVATMTTGTDGIVQSPLLPLGTYDLILDAPPPGYLTADARGVSVSSPIVQTFVFSLRLDPNPPPTNTPTRPPVSPSPSIQPSPSIPATATARAATSATSTAQVARTSTPRATATSQATATPLPTATATSGAPSAPATGRWRPTLTPAGTAPPRTATATARTATATPRLTTGTALPATATPTTRPATVVATVGGSLARAPRPTYTVVTSTRTATPRPASTSTAPRAPRATSTVVRTPRVTATVPASPTQPAANPVSGVTVEVVICIDSRFTNSGEFGSATDLGPRYLTDIDRSRCRPARSGETLITLTAARTTLAAAYAQTSSTDSAGRITFVVPAPASREAQIATLHVEGDIAVSDLGVRLLSGQSLTFPLTVVVPDPAAQPIGVTTGAGSGSLPTAGPAGPSAILTTLGLMLLVAFGLRRLIPLGPASDARREGSAG